jgi:hypothetical protein
MALVPDFNYLNGCIWSAQSAGTGSFVVNAAETGYYAPLGCSNPAVVNGTTYNYFARNGVEHEEGQGVWNSTTQTLTRATVFSSSNSGGAVNFSVAPIVYMGCALANDFDVFSVISTHYLQIANGGTAAIKIGDSTDDTVYFTATLLVAGGIFSGTDNTYALGSSGNRWSAIYATEGLFNSLSLTLGSDATGDIFYRNSGGTVSRLGIGTSAKFLGVASGLPAWLPARQQLTATANYYVNASSSSGVAGPGGSVNVGGGSDSTGTGTAAAPWQTLQHAYNQIITQVDLNLQVVNIYLAHGSSTNYALSAIAGPFIGTSVVNVIGDSNDQTQVTIQAPTGLYALQVKDLSCLNVSYVTFADNASTNGAGLIVCGLGNYGHIDMHHCTLKAINTGAMISVTYGGSVSFVNSGMIIAGNAGVAMVAMSGGVIDTGGQTVTVSGTPAFSTCFAYILDGGVISATSSTFSGSATGQKFQIYGALTLGGYDPATVFPGNSTGLTTLAYSPVSMTNTVTFADGGSWSSSGPTISSANIATIYGGSAANETFTLQSTSNGSPSGDSLVMAASSFTIQPIGSGSSKLNVSAGTLAAGAQSMLITATQPASPVATQNAILWQITSAGSASIANVGWNLTYLAGYTGNHTTRAAIFTNAAAGTANNPLSYSTTQGNIGFVAATSSTTIGANIGGMGEADGGNVNMGLQGQAITAKNSATNIGVTGYGLNTGSSPVEVGVWATMNSTLPTVSATLIADNGSEAIPVALFMVGGATKFTVDNPSLKVYTVTTLPSAAGAGAIALVSDATSNVLLGAGGGSAYCLAVWNGSAWAAL